MDLTPAQYNLLLSYSGAMKYPPSPTMLEAQYWLADHGYLTYVSSHFPKPWRLTLKGRAVLYKVKKSLACNS